MAGSADPVEAVLNVLENLSFVPAHYTWEPLSSEHSIRLLGLKAATHVGDALHCRLIDVNLDQAVPAFEAISYACGDYNPIVPLHIDQIRESGHILHFGTGKVLITANLAAALKVFRYPDRDRLLWVDTVCINQADNTEKSQQVGIMHRIYRAATTTLSWLGTDDDLTERGFIVIGEIAREARSYGLETIFPIQRDLHYILSAEAAQKRQELSTDRERGSAILSIFLRDYFSRRWILQEFSLAQDIVIYCGSHRMHWTALACAAAVIRLLHGGAIPPSWPKKGPSSQVQEVTFLRYRLRDPDPSKKQKITLLYMLKAYELQACRDPHDFIYAYLGLAEDEGLPNFSALRPDYSLDIEQLFFHVAIFYLAHDIRILHHIRNQRTMKFTFVPDWRFNTTTLALGGFGFSKYSAGVVQDLCLRSTVEFNTALLPAVGGWFVDEIIINDCCPMLDNFLQSPIAAACTLLYNCHQHYNNDRKTRPPYPMTDEDITIAFARTMVGDSRHPPIKEHIGEHTTPEQMLALVKDALALIEPHAQKVDATGFWSVDAEKVVIDLSRAEDASESTRGRPILGFLQAVATLYRNRCFFITMEGFIGFGPRDTKILDVVAVLLGAETPFILHPLAKKDQNPDEQTYRRVSRKDFTGTSTTPLISFASDISASDLPESTTASSESAHEQAHSDKASSPPPDTTADDTEEPVQEVRSDSPDSVTSEPTYGPNSRRPLPEPYEASNIYQVVGEAYVHGIMYGEYLKYEERKRMFELR